MTIGAGILKGIGTQCGKAIFENIKLNGIKKFFLYKTKYRNKEIRLSVAYLIRINIRGKGYLLVKNSKIIDQFQPVGGVYKYNREGLDFLKKIKFREDEGYKSNENNKNDLRIRIKGRFLSKFVRWFKSKNGREVTAYREFKEELLDTGILKEEFFDEQNVDIRFETRVIGDMKFSNHFQCDEILISDIYDFYPNLQQEKELKSLPNEDGNYRFFSYDEIKRLGKVSGEKEYRVGEHTLKILEGEVE
ncbi:hypothetical protein ELS18_02275 [Clostridium perfringens]|uniref:SMODS-associated NUDIX domain-containing protein n=1 Tax=Clostridium perfringens TaxID=1502 RepID=UPI000F8E9AF4|nr:hypothetical protein [Clostridium perfringens]RUR41863.1 hypothetical protein ELS18_02275 [Clostridium perfringens]